MNALNDIRIQQEIQEIVLLANTYSFLFKNLSKLMFNIELSMNEAEVSEIEERHRTDKPWLLYVTLLYRVKNKYAINESHFRSMKWPILI